MPRFRLPSALSKLSGSAARRRSKGYGKGAFSVVFDEAAGWFGPYVVARGKSATFVRFVGGSLEAGAAVEPGVYDSTYRFVERATGRATGLQTLGVVTAGLPQVPAFGAARGLIDDEPNLFVSRGEAVEIDLRVKLVGNELKARAPAGPLRPVFPNIPL